MVNRVQETRKLIRYEFSREEIYTLMMKTVRMVIPEDAEIKIDMPEGPFHIIYFEEPKEGDVFEREQNISIASVEDLQ